MRVQIRNRSPIEWRYTEDGFLRVTMCVLREDVRVYAQGEFKEAPEFQGYKELREYIPLEEFTPEALASLEGMEVLVGEHEWRIPGDATSPADGSIAGSPRVEGGGIFCDAIIRGKDAIRRITEETLPEWERLIEVSAGYSGELIPEAGEFNGLPYDARQTNIRFNHILLLPAGEGRCGPSVRITNQRMEAAVPEEQKEKQTLILRFGNAEKKFRFSNEEDRKEAESMVEEERKFNASQLEKSMSEKKELEAQIATLTAKLAEHDKTLQDARAKIDELLKIEVQEAKAEELANQKNDEESIVSEEVGSSEEKEKVLNSIRKGDGDKLSTMAERRFKTVTWVLNKKGAKAPESWKQEAYDAAFDTMALNAATKPQPKVERVLNGGAVAEQVSIQSPRERMLSRMDFFNKKENKNGK